MKQKIVTYDMMYSNFYDAIFLFSRFKRFWDFPSCCQTVSHAQQWFGVRKYLDKMTSLMVSKSLDTFNFRCENNESRSAAGTPLGNHFRFFVPSFRPCWQSVRGCSESSRRLFKSEASGGNFQLFFRQAFVVNLYIQTQLCRSILLHIPVQWCSASLWICFLILNRWMSSN